MQSIPILVSATFYLKFLKLRSFLFLIGEKVEKLNFMFMIVRSINVVLKIRVSSGINCILFIFYWKNKIIIIMYTHKMNIFCLFSLSEVEQAHTHMCWRTWIDTI